MQEAGAGMSPAIAAALTTRTPLMWLNPGRRRDRVRRADDPRLEEAVGRFARAEQLLIRLFPEMVHSGGVIDSPLLSVPKLQAELSPAMRAAQIFLKADHALPVAGSVKARGGFHEVLAHAESLAIANGLSVTGADLEVLMSARARKLFASHTIAVGSTGNLGLSIGIMASALGFKVIVHMSRDAKAWKKAALRQRGVRVVEHDGDYAVAVAAGREACESDPSSYFVDDESSPLLFMGYAVAARHLKAQLIAAGRTPSASRPLFVHIPCGVGGAAGGIAFGLDQLFGDHVHCFFAEPVDSPCMLVQMASGLESPVSVYQFGLDNHTEADGLAVPQASQFVASEMLPVVAGVFTVTDDQMFSSVLQAWNCESLELEPSAAAGFCGPQWIHSSEAGRQYIEANELEANAADATHLLWTTGGAQVPKEEHEQFRDKARRLETVT